MQHALDGHAEKTSEHVALEDKNGPKSVAAQKQLADESRPANSSAQTPRERRFTEQREERRVKQEMREEDKARDGVR